MKTTDIGFKRFEEDFIKQPVYVKQEPYVGDDGIYIPCDEYVLEGYVTNYRCVLTKKMFVEAYNKWIKGE